MKKRTVIEENDLEVVGRARSLNWPGTNENVPLVRIGVEET